MYESRFSVVMFEYYKYKKEDNTRRILQRSTTWELRRLARPAKHFLSWGKSTLVVDQLDRLNHTELCDMSSWKSEVTWCCFISDYIRNYLIQENLVELSNMSAVRRCRVRWSLLYWVHEIDFLINNYLLQSLAKRRIQRFLAFGVQRAQDFELGNWASDWLTAETREWFSLPIRHWFWEIQTCSAMA